MAGTGAVGFLDGPVSSAMFNEPNNLRVDAGGKIYVSEKNNRVRVITGAKVDTLAGSGLLGFADGPALSAKLSTPWGVGIGASGVVYVGDRGNHRIRAYYP